MIEYERIKHKEDKYNYETDRIAVKCVFDMNKKGAQKYLKEAQKLADMVNPHKANQSNTIRTSKRLLEDAFAGILAERGWLLYIQKTFGKETVKIPDFVSSNGQIDLQLSNGKTIEVRSSFAKNGLEFALCNKKYNFKNICKYNNLYKSSEVDKDFFAVVIFETPKEKLLTSDKIVFHLIGGSTRRMMQNDKIAFNENLRPMNNSSTMVKTNYRVILLKDCLDISNFEKYIVAQGIPKLKEELKLKEIQKNIWR